MASQTSESPSEGVIAESALYTMREACRRLGIGRAGWRSALKAGLKPIRKLGRTFVSGREIVRFLTDGPE